MHSGMATSRGSGTIFRYGYLRADVDSLQYDYPRGMGEKGWWSSDGVVTMIKYDIKFQ